MTRPALHLDRDAATWRRSLASRTRRLNELLELAGDRGLPRFLVSAEIDLVRGALEALDALCGDRATQDALRAKRPAND